MPGAHASSPDIGAVLCRVSYVASRSGRCGGVCPAVESALLSCEAPEDPRLLVCGEVAAATGAPLSGVLAWWDAAPVVSGRPLAESVAREVAEGHAHAERLGDALVRLESLSHVSLVWHQASKVSGSFSGYAAADLVGWGWSGLRMALRRFDPSMGYAFSTYACTRIVGAIRDGVRSERAVPKRLGTFQRQLDVVAEELAERLGRQPTVSELAERVGEPEDKVLAAHRARSMVSFDELAESGRDVAPPFVADMADVLSPEVDSMLSDLPEVEADVLRMVVLEGWSDREVAAHLGISQAAVRRLREAAIDRLRSSLA